MVILDPGQLKELSHLIPDGSTVALSGNGMQMLPESLLAGIEETFLAEGHPRGLSLYYPALPGAREGTGIDHLAHAGLVRAIIASYSFIL